jgi:hypothetical protein
MVAVDGDLTLARARQSLFNAVVAAFVNRIRLRPAAIAGPFL